MKDYLLNLDCQHTPPHRVECIHLLEVILDAGMLELSRIIEDTRSRLVDSFMSGTIDFWTESYRRECFAVMMIDLIAEKYVFNNGQMLFMSRETRSKVDSKMIIGEASLDIFDAPLNFYQFDKESKLFCVHVIGNRVAY